MKYCSEQYRQAKENHKNYWEWKRNRNEKRSELEEKFGYDTKHAAHLVRLLRMGEEILKGEGVKVRRPDAQELLAIRNGEWDYEDLVKWAESKDTEIREVLYKKTSLPKTPDIALASKILINIQDICWS